LLGPLRKHYRGDPRIQVIVDRRKGPRRKPVSMSEPSRPPMGREDLRSQGDRRRPVLPRSVAPLPKDLPDVGQVNFVQRLLPVSDAMQKLDTADVLARVRQGDPEAPTELFWRLYERVHSHLCTLLGVPSEADREVVNAFGRLLDALEVEGENRPFEALLYEVVDMTGADVNARHAAIPVVVDTAEGSLEISDPTLDEPVVVQDRDPRWFHRAMGERDRLVRSLGADVIEIQHVGSTAVPAIAARPIIDLILAPASREAEEALRAKLVGLGYTDCGSAGNPKRVYLRRRGLLRIDLHLIPHEGRMWREAVALRDFLRRNPVEASRWASAKRDAARRSGHSYVQYVEMRSKALAEVTERAFGKTRNERAEPVARA
jgi:GrpB-like predicted nucleotidyltransferase (UPF0157 family)